MKLSKARVSELANVAFHCGRIQDTFDAINRAAMEASVQDYDNLQLLVNMIAEHGLRARSKHWEKIDDWARALLKAEGEFPRERGGA